MESEFDETEKIQALGTREARQKALAASFERHRGRLRLMIHLRLDPRLRRRIGPSDVLQEAFLEASHRLEKFLERPPMPLFLWLRRIAGQKLLGLHRHHLAVKGRDARREVSIQGGTMPHASSVVLAKKLVVERTSPLQEAIRAETKTRVEKALEAMEPLDREVLALRHYEELSNSEVARVLGIKEAAAGMRYIRALERLRKILGREEGSRESP
jgi:RNA polymerase sigma-70 factor (ECF subfamily)